MAAKDQLVEDDEKPGTEELIITETPPSAAGGDEKEPSQRGASAQDEAEDDHDEEDERTARTSEDSTGDPERDAIRERRRVEKVERKVRREEAIRRDKLELDFLRRRNDDLERRVGSVEAATQSTQRATLEQQLKTTQEEIRMAENVIAKAVAAGNGEDVTQAMRYRDQAIGKANQLAAVRHQAEQRAKAPPAPAEQAIDSRTLAHAQSFINENTWYDPQGRDEDSAVVLALDSTLAREGFDQASPEYWKELRTRVAKRMPERFASESQAEERRPRGGPQLGSGRQHAPESTRREVYISPERKQALVDAGVWDDPVLRQKYVKRYSEYDRQQKSNA